MAGAFPSMAGPVFLPLLLVHWTVKSVWSVSGVLATWSLWRSVWSLLVEAGFDLMCSSCPPTGSPCLSVLDLALSTTSPPAPIVVGWPRLLMAPHLLLASFHSPVLLPPSAVLCRSTLDGYGEGRSVNCHGRRTVGQHTVAIGIAVGSQ